MAACLQPAVFILVGAQGWQRAASRQELQHPFPAQGQIDAQGDDEELDGDVTEPAPGKRQAVCPVFLVVRHCHRHHLSNNPSPDDANATNSGVFVLDLRQSLGHQSGTRRLDAGSKGVRQMGRPK